MQVGITGYVWGSLAISRVNQERLSMLGQGMNHRDEPGQLLTNNPPQNQDTSQITSSSTCVFYGR